MLQTGLLAVALLAVAGGCAPTLVSGRMPNPAASKDKLQSSQEFDIGPYKENHRYTMTVAGWTPSTLGVQIKLADIGECGRPESYSFTLVDDHGASYPFQQTGTPTMTTEPGRANVTLNVSTVSGDFAAPIGADAHAITIQQRPRPNVGCPALDFRWAFDSNAPAPQSAP